MDDAHLVARASGEAGDGTGVLLESRIQQLDRDRGAARVASAIDHAQGSRAHARGEGVVLDRLAAERIDAAVDEFEQRAPDADAIAGLEPDLGGHAVAIEVGLVIRLAWTQMPGAAAQT